jgi:DNA mismatch repair protein MutS
MMKQYTSMKAKYPDCFLFFRMGDFYEMFGEDAVKGAPILDIALTSRDRGPDDERMPMCGVPHHAVWNYIRRMINSGQTVAICEQMEDPSKAKGIVKRDVIRVITPGTVIEDELMEEGAANYLAAIVPEPTGVGLALCDVSRASVYLTELQGTDSIDRAVEELARFGISELLLPEKFENDKLNNAIDAHSTSTARYRVDFDDEWRRPKMFEDKLGVKDESHLPFGDHPLAATALYRILTYLDRANPAVASNIERFTYYEPDTYMSIDETTKNNLEIFRSQRTGEKKNSLLWVLDKTRTVLGRRFLQEVMSFPLMRRAEIQSRHEGIEELLARPMIRAEISDALKGIRDIERIESRVAARAASPLDLASLRESLRKLPELKEWAGKLEASIFKGIFDGTEPLDELSEYLNDSLVVNPPANHRDGGVFADGFSAELDKLRDAARGGREWIASLQRKERELTGIKNLKIGYNKVFGYYLEISKANLHNVPAHFIRKQTLVNAERFITEELKNMEDEILSANEKAVTVETEMYNSLLEHIAALRKPLLQAASSIALIDLLLCFAECASQYRWCRPELNEGMEMFIEAGRHPVIEITQRDEPFVPNDADFNTDDKQLNIITGPNMAGKSTYLRQVALTAYLNQIGSFVPADSARLPIYDAVFSRVGATDDLALGQSTFMVEMLECSRILHNATGRSLIILDEIGRGTSTYDGLAIAWSVAEYIHNHPDLRSITLFATHYHELTRLSEFLPGVRNLRIMLQERDGDIVFLRRVTEGRAQKSYGIQVAKLAGLPKQVVDRATDIMKVIEASKISPDIIAMSAREVLSPRVKLKKDEDQIDLFGKS